MRIQPRHFVSTALPGAKPLQRPLRLSKARETHEVETLGPYGLQKLAKLDSDAVAGIAEYLRVRGIQLARYSQLSQDWILAGLTRWQSKRPSKFSILEALEIDLNARLQWTAPKNLQGFVRQARRILDLRKPESAFADAVKKTKAWWHARNGHLPASDYWPLLQASFQGSRGDLASAHRALRALPRELTHPKARYLHQLLSRKRDALPVCGAAGRTVVLPLEMAAGGHIEQSFALVHFPVDDDLRRRLEKHNKLEHRVKVRQRRYGGEPKSFLFSYSPSNFPGALVYSIVSIGSINEYRQFQSAFGAPNNSFDLAIVNAVQSDARQFAPEHAPPELNRQYIAVTEAFIDMMDPDYVFYPTVETVAAWSKTSHFPEAQQQRGWLATLQDIYGKPPSPRYLPVQARVGNGVYFYRAREWERRRKP